MHTEKYKHGDDRKADTGITKPLDRKTGHVQQGRYALRLVGAAVGRVFGPIDRAIDRHQILIENTMGIDNPRS